MPAVIRLSEVPQRFLDLSKWTELRAFAPSDISALTYLNSPFPDEDNPSDFFWRGDRSFDEALRCYRIGRELLGQCRGMLIERKLLAIGSRPGGAREMIPPLEWADLWPMFATNRATGPNNSFDDVGILESTPPVTPYQTMLLDCLCWFRLQNSETLKQKKLALLYLAQREIGTNLTHAVFNVAYKATLGHPRGRPRK
jgi:hypothetical protein